MFARFRKTKTTLQVSVLRSHRNDEVVRHQFIGMIGTIALAPTFTDRVAFWQRAHQRLAQLGDRIDPETQAKLIGDIAARVPDVTSSAARQTASYLLPACQLFRRPLDPLPKA